MDSTGLAIMVNGNDRRCVMIFAYVAGNTVFARYLFMPYIPGAGELAVLLGAMVGAGLGLPVVQRLSGRGLYGRCWRVGTGWRARHQAADRAAGNRVGDHGRCLVAETLSVAAQVLYFRFYRRQTDFSYGALASSL